MVTQFNFCNDKAHCLITGMWDRKRGDMSIPMVKEGDWITVGDSNVDAYVFHVHSETEVSAGYYQNRSKQIKEDFVWDGEYWQFKYQGPNGSYLRGREEAIVKRGPPR